jgi:hypothetical protein
VENAQNCFSLSFFWQWAVLFLFNLIEALLHLVPFPIRSSLRISNLEGAMDKDKGIVETAIEAVKEFASEVSDAAKHAMEPSEPIKPGDKVVMMPVVSDGMMGESMMPSFVVIRRGKKASKASKKKAAPNTSGRITPTYDFPVPYYPMPSPKKKRKAKKAAKKTAPKKSKTATKTSKETPKKSAKSKVGKKTAKKSKKTSKR